MFDKGEWSCSLAEAFNVLRVAAGDATGGGGAFSLAFCVGFGVRFGRLFLAVVLSEDLLSSAVATRFCACIFDFMPVFA